jgi:hypothetical protein
MASLKFLEDRRDDFIAKTLLETETDGLVEAYRR